MDRARRLISGKAFPRIRRDLESPRQKDKILSQIHKTSYCGRIRWPSNNKQHLAEGKLHLRQNIQSSRRLGAQNVYRPNWAFSRTIPSRKPVHHSVDRVRWKFNSGRGNAESNFGRNDQSISNIGTSAERMRNQAKTAYLEQ